MKVVAVQTLGRHPVIKELPDPEAGSGEVRVRVRAADLCRTGRVPHGRGQDRIVFRSGSGR
ncbi:hypothetical protein ABZV24_01040 [Streptomyces sp. NPDC005251]|uniref:hypothetical protein n=1 Tax=Streptomyces sp. NPDC005251 TaxID=3157166 RepID=UPI0033AE5914